MPKSSNRRKNTKAQSKKANREKNEQHSLKGPMARRALADRQARRPLSEQLWSTMPEVR